MTLYHKLCRSSLDIQDLGFIPCTAYSGILGTTTDGTIHFCTKEGHGETVFAVGEKTVPVSKNFSDFLGLLYCCKDAKLLSQIPGWTRLRFDRESNRISLSYKQQMIRNALFNCFHPPVIEDAYGYVQSLQSNNAASQNCPGTEKSSAPQVSVAYGDTVWHAKELQILDDGVEVTLCVEIPGQRILNFYDRWEDTTPNVEQLLTMNAEDPFALHVELRAMINGMEQTPDIAEIVRWDPLSDPTADAEKYINQFKLNKEQGWLFLRLRFGRLSKKKKSIRSLVLNLQSKNVTIPGLELVTPMEQNSVSLTHPVTGNTHTLTIHSCTDEGLDPNFLINPPCFYTRLCYSLSPALSTDAFMIFDPLPNDRLRTPLGDTSPYPDEDYENAPTAQLVEADETLPAHVRTVFSARHYDPRRNIRWQTRFCCKLQPDAVLPIIR